MNIFAVDSSPIVSAQSLVDRHVVKMILETAQLLSTAHRVVDGSETIEKSKVGRKIKRWKLSDNRETKLYLATHINHPSSIWCRASNNNYNWLYIHFLELLREYTYRYNKIHKCSFLVDVLKTPPCNITIGPKTSVTATMPDVYKIRGNSVESYRNYYRLGKAHLHKWTNRTPPDWIK